MKKTLLLRSAIVWNRFLTEGKGQNETTSNEATPAKVADCGEAAFNNILIEKKNRNDISRDVEKIKKLTDLGMFLKRGVVDCEVHLMEKLLLNISIQTFINLQNKKTIATCSTTASCIILFRPVLTEQQQVKRDEENYSAWSKGKKSKFYNEMIKSILPNKEANVIKSKLARLIKKYKSIKKHNKLIIKLVKIKRTGIGNFYADQLIPAGIKDLFNSANRETVMATAIAEMGQKLKKEQLEVEKERWVYKRERSRIEFELRIKELDLKF
ncbi:hypothetical protein GLOIN_2v1771939 [Rhizophagus irregularis DAOM 181602=DAOM 197198]|uniref:Uncharacterized protein n=1 Tax=Rhizophagus irregularis (strain DAOM 181602 / DAOM 197198 / MUCL 43194) TaxID=747089 RepID=A0A2P4Q8K8_RHIID|nr:hypothetical protein GLOIN_2v1771939 [Rhizophagus irregularis DAOM 181602=DAOM 197198]POG73952.1 hypothetical protein GLOIN_2v1771939 [Rhizophagus irregularis DAOM 181602=DAOM 197198]GBC34125.2 hypothetical protein GLOIN_2v1771939 [Rhizophagus irregularis DAOM 181602=DAOM 197198]|eukprot:XP_025180818.1 hypothetical protein GLOIN_2v1771939 [Rhizophagus irregularis DAOM 181602=DAOM 197198]